MNRIRVSTCCRALIFNVSVLIFCSSCGSGSTSKSQVHLPGSAYARQAVEASLKSWHDSPDLPTTSKPSPTVIFVDQQRRTGQRLLVYSLLGETESESGRRFLVRLSLAEPDESLLASYYVFGEDPTWVYRSEDFDMIMHWEMPADSTVPAEPPKSEDRLNMQIPKGTSRH